MLLHNDTRQWFYEICIWRNGIDIVNLLEKKGNAKENMSDSNSVMVSLLEEQTITTEFESYWVPYTSGQVPKSCKTSWIISEKGHWNIVWLLFYGISTFAVYLMLKQSLLKNSSDTIYPPPAMGADKMVHTFSKGICPKVNVIVRLEFELTDYVIAVQHVSHNTPRTECSSIAWETGVQFQVELYQRLKNGSRCLLA